MKEKLHILLVEDTPSDIKLLKYELAKEFKVELSIVQTEKEFRKALKTFQGDLIISDYSLPKFNGMRALKIRETEAKHLPFILVTGSINEETAVDVMKAGADDYVIKEHLSRLNSAINSVLLKYKISRERIEAEAHFKNIFENSIIGLYRTTPDGKILLANPALLKMLEFKSISDLNKRNIEKNGFAKGFSRTTFKRLIKKNDEIKGLESAWLTKTGKTIYVNESARAIKDGNGNTLYYEGVVEDITTKKLALDALKESTRKFNTMIDNLSGIVYRCKNDSDWTMEYISEAVYDLTEYLSSDFTSKKISYSSVIHPEDREMVWDTVQKSLKRKKPFTLEYRIITAGGVIKWVWERGRGVFEKNQLIALEGFITDITERKTAEENLFASEKKFRALIEKSSEVFAMLSSDGIINYASPNTKIIYGYTSKELVGKSGFEFIHPEDLPAVTEKFLQILETPGNYANIVCRFKHKNGRWLYSEVFSSNLLHDPEVNAIVLNYHDISEKKAKEEEIRIAAEKFRSIVEGTRAILFSTNEKGIFTYVNDAACKTFGLKEEDVIGKFYLKFVHSESRNTVHAAFTEQLKNPTPNVNIDVRISTKVVKDGWLNLMVNPIYDGEMIIGLTAVALNVTDKKLAEENLKKRIEHLQLLNDLNISLQGILDIKEMIKKSYLIIPKFLNIDRTSIFMYEERLDGLISESFIGEDIELVKPEIQPLNIGISGKCFIEDRVLAIDDCSATDIIPKEYVKELKLKSTVAVPLRAEGKPIGVLRLDYLNESHSFAMEELDFLNLLGNQLGIILRNAQLFTEQSRTSIALKESEEKFRNVVETANEGIIITDPSDNIIFANETFAKMVGIELNELTNKNYISLLPDEDKRLFLKYNTERRLGLSDVYEQKLNKKNGDSIYAIVSASPIIDSEKKFQGSFGMFTDITDRKHAAEKLLESERSYVGLFNSVTEAIYIQDSEGKFIDVNQGAINMYGYSHPDFIGRTPEFLSAPYLNDKLNIPEVLKTVLRGGKPVQFEFWGKRKNGEIFPKEVICNRGRYFGKEVLIITARDITERKNAEDSLRQSEEKFFKAFLASPDAVLITRMSDGQILEVNEGFCRITEYSKDEAIGRTTLELNLWMEEAERDFFISLMQKHGFVREQEFKYRVKSGRTIISLLSAEIILIGGEKYLLAIVRDITERKRAEAVLNKRLKLEQIISSISSRFIKLEANELDSEINYALKEVGKNTDSDRSYVYYFSDDLSTFSNTHEWCAEGISAQRENQQNVPTSQFEWWMDELKVFNPIHIGDVDQMSEESINEKKSLQLQEIKALLVVPLVSANKLIGFVGFDSVRTKKTWAEEDIIVLKILSEIFSNTISRINSESALRQSEEKYRSIFETAVEGICGIDENTVIKYCNPQFAKMLGYEVDELIGHEFYQLVVHNDRENFSNKLEERKTGKRDVFERHLIRKDGIEIIAKASVAPSLDEQGNYAGAFGMFTDITEEKKKEAELKKLSLGIHQNSASVVITDPKGAIEYVNPHFTLVTGYTFEEAIGKNPRILKSGQTDPALYKELWNTIINGDVWRGEFLNKKKNGDLFWESVSISPIKNDKNEITNFIAIKDDITEKKKLIEELTEAKEKAEEMNRVKSSFFANMSHELRTPLIGILGFAEVIQDELQNDPHFVKMAKNIHLGGKRLLETLNMILNISKIESGKIDARFDKIEIVSILRDVVSLYSQLAMNKNINLEFRTDEEKIICYADEKLVGDIFNNLVNNALKFTDTGSIIVEASINQHHTVIKVTDTGIGIPLEKQELIWEEFRQSSEGLGRGFEGTGLGLTISRKYVELMGGQIYLESKEGIGSTFIIELPLVSQKN